MAIFLAYIFYFIVGTLSPLQRRWLASKHETRSGGQIDFAFKVTLIIGLLGLVIPFLIPAEIHSTLFILMRLSLITGFSGAIFYATQFTAQKHVDAGITTLTNNLYTPVTIFLASIFLQEGLTLKQIAGTILLLLSLLLVSQKHRIKRFEFDKYFMMMVVSGVSMGILLTAERALQKETGFTTGTLLSWWSQTIALGVLTYITKSTSVHTLKNTLITGGLKFLQALSWVILIYVVANLSVVSAVTTFKVVVVFVAAAVFLGERDHLTRKIIGSFIAVIGLLLMK